MAQTDRVKQKLFEALGALVSDGDINWRLTFAAVYLLHLTESDIPAELKDRLATIRNKLTVTPLSSDKEYLPRQLSDDEARAVTGEILSLFVTAMGGLWRP